MYSYCKGLFYLPIKCLLYCTYFPPSIPHLHLTLWEIWDCLVLNHPKPNRTTSLQERGGWETSGKGPSWEVSAVDPDCSPSSVGQTDEGGSVICFLLLQCRASHSCRSVRDQRTFQTGSGFLLPTAGSWLRDEGWHWVLRSQAEGTGPLLFPP